MWVAGQCGQERGGGGGGAAGEARWRSSGVAAWVVVWRRGWWRGSWKGGVGRGGVILVEIEGGRNPEAPLRYAFCPLATGRREMEF